MSGEPSSADVEIGLHTGSEVDPPVPGSNASTMSTVSSCTERDSNDSSELGVDEQSLREYELVRCVIFSTRDNINVVHEVFRQVCQRHTSLQFSSVSSVVLREYTVWARWRFRISPPRFLAKCRMSRLNQASFVLLYFVLFAFTGLCLVFVVCLFSICLLSCIFLREPTRMALYSLTVLMCR